MGKEIKKKKILFLANHFITLFSFRKELIQRLITEGHDIYLSIPEDENRYFENLGCHVIVTAIDRHGLNPYKDLKLIFFYKKLLSKINPDIIFSYTIKPNIYGCFASGKKYKQICNITGTGATFLKDNWISKMCRILYRYSVRNCYKVFFQNKGDCELFLKYNMVTNYNWEMLPGSGVNLEYFLVEPMPTGNNVNFIFIGRVMKLKGIDEYLKAARIIKENNENVSFYIAGWNEEAEYKRIVSRYEQDGIVKYIGFQKNIKEWIKRCHCTVLPSHGGEGIPNVLLESAAMGRICIGSNISGTKEVIEDGVTGFLFDAYDTAGLVEAIQKVISLDNKQRTIMGLSGRKKIEKEFNRQIVIQKYLEEMDKLE